MKTYEKYKNSGVSWLGKIPEHWKMRKIKRIFSERVEKGFPDEELLVASQNMGVVPKSIYGNRTVEAQKDLHLLKLVKVGDFVISLRSFQGGIEYAYYQGIISPAYTIMINNGLIESSYFKYLAKSRRFIELLKICVTGIREGQNIDYNKLKNNLIPVPPLAEQEAIAKFLDYKVSRIERLILIRERQIVNLKELKKGVINKAVTKGLKPNVKLKDSGVKWLGKIPGHWKMAKLRKIFTERSTKVSDKDYSALSVGYMGVVPQLETAAKTDNGDNRKLICKGDFAINSRSDRKGAGGISEYTGSASMIITVLKPHKDINGKFYHYLLRSHYFSEEFYRNGRGLVSDLWTTNWNNMRNILVPVPPLAEQNEIAKYLDKKCAQIDKLITIREKQITELNELKARLISDVVTGKIDVR